MSSGSQSLSASRNRVFFPGMELVVQLVDGWFLEIKVGEATQVWEEHLIFLMDMWNHISVLGCLVCVCAVLQHFLLFRIRVGQRKQFGGDSIFFFRIRRSLFCLLLLRSRVCVLGF